MRLNAKVATAGKAGLYRFPAAKASIDECLTPDGRFDEGKARAALNTEQIQVGQKDDRRVIAFTMEFLKQQESVVRRMAEKVNADGVCAAVTDADGYRTTAATMGDRHCESRMDKGRNVYVRTDITGCADGIHVKLSTGNPHGVVGYSEEFARECAIMLARILIYLRGEITTTKLTLIEGKGAEGVFAEAEELDRRDDLAKMRAACERLHNGHCSPCKFDCPLYANGKCKDPTKEEV